MYHQEATRNAKIGNGVEYDPYDAVKALERRIGLYWRISSCFHDRMDAATQAAMTVGKANRHLTAIKMKTQPNTLIHKLCNRLQMQIIHGNDDGCRV